MPPKGKKGDAVKPEAKAAKAPVVKKKPPTAADKGAEYIRAKELDNLETLLKENVRLINRHEIKSGKNMLHIAVEEGLLNYVDLLIDYGCNLNFRSADKQTAVMLAAYGKEDEILEYLIKRGANITLTGKDNDTALHIAVRRGHLSTVEILVKEIERIVAEQTAEEEFQASLLRDDDDDDDEEVEGEGDGGEAAPATEGETVPLGIVDTSGTAPVPAPPTESPKSPGAAGSAPSVGSSGAAGGAAAGTEPAATAAEEEEPEEEEKGAQMDRKVIFSDEIEMKNEKAETPLGNAIKMQVWQISEYLLSKGADINTIGMNGNTPLMRSCYDGKLDSVKHCLKRSECNLHARNINGETALLISIKQKYFHIAEYLIKEHHANIEDTDEIGNNALHFGAMINHLPTMKFAVEVGHISIDAVNNWGTTAVMYCAKQIHGKKALDYLLSHNCDLNIQDKRFATALMYACRLDDIWRASLLVEHGADPNIVDQDGNNALKYIPDHNVINERGNLELHDENVKQYINCLETYADTIDFEDGVTKENIRGTEGYKFDDKCEVNFKGRGKWYPAKILRVRMGANVGTFDVEYLGVATLGVASSKYPPRHRPEWLDRQNVYEIREAREIAWDKWVNQNIDELKTLKNAEIQQQKDEERQMRLDEEERIRKLAEWEALPEEEKEKILRRKAKEAAKEKEALRAAAIERGEDPDAMEEAMKKKELSRKAAENRAAKLAAKKAKGK